MSVIAELALQSPKTVLHQTMTSRPDVRIEIESLDGVDPERPSFVLWANGENLDAFEETLRADDTVGDLRVLDRFDGRWLYRFQFTENVEVVFYPTFVKLGASLLTLCGQDGEWKAQMRFPDRGALSSFREFCVNNDVTVRLDRVYDEPEKNVTPLTDSQREAVSVAFEAGYFEVPRDASLETVADELGVSQQAASERLRRAMRHLAADVTEK